jgi:two-component system, OmpR family, sensor kinase
MKTTVRLRLTIWYTAVLALVLVALSAATYFIFDRNAATQADRELKELCDSFLVTLRDEARDPVNGGNIAPALEQSIAEHRSPDLYFAVFDATGSMLLSSADLADATADDRENAERVRSSRRYPAFLEAAGKRDEYAGRIDGRRGGFRGYARGVSVRGQKYLVVILHSQREQHDMLEDIRTAFLGVIPLAIALAALGGYFLARKSLAPVVAMSAQAARISASNLNERLAIRNSSDELGSLAAAFNDLLARLEQSFERQRRFMADASHELRTPVAILRGEAEVALENPSRAAGEYREALATVRQEARRLTKIIEDLFTLTRADAGQHPLARTDFYFDELAAECVQSVRTLAAAKNLHLRSEITPEIQVHADELLMRRMILNLLDNAIKYTPTGGAVAVSCLAQGGQCQLTISNAGPGIPPELQRRVFERFFRADPARTQTEQDGGGAGLGLSIARWIAEAHEGRLELVRSDGQETVFRVTLPSVAIASQKEQAPA